MRRSDSPAPGAYKMVLVVRGELRLTPGKMAVQVAHAAVLLLDEMGGSKSAELVERWKSEGARKIAVLADNLEEMKLLERAAKARGLATVMVQDAGYTEVAPGTVTCLGIGPGRASDIDAVTGKLSLL